MPSPGCPPGPAAQGTQLVLPQTVYLTQAEPGRPPCSLVSLSPHYFCPKPGRAASPTVPRPSSTRPMRAAQRGAGRASCLARRSRGTSRSPPPTRPAAGVEGRRKASPPAPRPRSRLPEAPASRRRSGAAATVEVTAAGASPQPRPNKSRQRLPQPSGHEPGGLPPAAASPRPPGPGPGPATATGSGRPRAHSLSPAGPAGRNGAAERHCPPREGPPAEPGKTHRE